LEYQASKLGNYQTSETKLGYIFRVDMKFMSTWNSCRHEIHVDGIPCRRNSVSTEFHVDRI